MMSIRFGFTGVEKSYDRSRGGSTVTKSTKIRAVVMETRRHNYYYDIVVISPIMTMYTVCMCTARPQAEMFVHA